MFIVSTNGEKENFTKSGDAIAMYEQRIAENPRGFVALLYHLGEFTSVIAFFSSGTRFLSAAFTAER